MNRRQANDIAIFLIMSALGVLTLIKVAYEQVIK